MMQPFHNIQMILCDLKTSFQEKKIIIEKWIFNPKDKIL